MRNLVIIGDPHGYFERLRYIAMNFTNTDFICVGDVNVGYGDMCKSLNDRYEQFDGWNDELKDVGNVMYWVRGNHDNPHYWFEDRFNYSNIILVKDYEVLNLKKNVLCVGGAISIDRVFKKEGINYWKDENFFYDEELVKKIENIDIVVTHTAPDFAIPRESSSIVEINSISDDTLIEELKTERLEVSKMFLELTNKDSNKIKEWYYGHFHQSSIEYIDGVKFHLLDELEYVEV